MCDKKTELTCLDGSAFAIVFLIAQHAGATVLHMQPWAHVILINTEIWFANHVTKVVHFLVKNWY